MDFADLNPEFCADAILIRSRQSRLVALGKFKGAVVVAVVFRPLGTEDISMVSMRPASRNERKLHDQQAHLRS